MIDNQSDPGSWDRELRARGTNAPKLLVAKWNCLCCGWSGSEPSMSDASDLSLTANGDWKMQRVHLPICPSCFVELLRC